MNESNPIAPRPVFAPFFPASSRGEGVDGSFDFLSRPDRRTGSIAPWTPSPLPNTLALLAAADFAPAQWSDSSGNGNHAIQATGSKQLSLTGVAPNGVAVPSANGQRVMTLPSLLPTAGSYTKCALVRITNLTTAYNNLIAGPSNLRTFWTNQTAQPRLYFTSDVLVSSANLTSGVWALVAEVSAWSNRGNVQSTLVGHLIVSGKYAGSFPTSSATTNYTNGLAANPLYVAGLTDSLSTFGLVGDAAEFCVTSSCPGANHWNAYHARLRQLYGINVPDFTRQILLVGDSITTGYTATGSGPSWAAQLFAAQAAGTYGLNLGRSGWLSSELEAQAATDLYPKIDPRVPTTVVLFAGTNDLAYGGRTPAQVWASLSTTTTGCFAAGAVRVIIVPMLPRGAGLEAGRTALNGLIASGVAGIGAVTFDPSAVPMYAPGANASTTYFDADQIHPNNLGHTTLYGLIAPLV